MTAREQPVYSLLWYLNPPPSTLITRRDINISSAYENVPEICNERTRLPAPAERVASTSLTNKTLKYVKPHVYYQFGSWDAFMTIIYPYSDEFNRKQRQKPSETETVKFCGKRIESSCTPMASVNLLYWHVYPLDPRVDMLGLEVGGSGSRRQLDYKRSKTYSLLW